MSQLLELKNFKYLKKYNIEIVAPSSKEADCEEKLKKIYTILTNFGLKFSVNNNIFSDNCLPFYSNSLKERTKFIKQSLNKKTKSILWAYKGGYGAREVAEKLKNNKINNDKILIGFSDITVLHSYLNNNFNIPSIHGPNINSLINDENIIYDIENILSSQKSEYDLELINEGSIFKQNLNNIINSKITGGNLTILNNLKGSNLEPNFNSRIVFLEDINLKSYAIMRALTEAHFSGAFKKIKAFIFGEFTTSCKYVDITIKDFINNYYRKVPAFRVKNIGHSKINKPIILNANSILSFNKIEVLNPFYTK